MAQQEAGLYMATLPTRDLPPMRAKDVCMQNGRCSDAASMNMAHCSDDRCCDTAFRMQFKLWDTATNTVGQWTDAVDPGDKACLDADTLKDAASGNAIVLITRVLAPGVEGGIEAAHQAVIYDDTATPATYMCKKGISWERGYACRPEDNSRRLQGVGEGR